LPSPVPSTADGELPAGDAAAQQLANFVVGMIWGSIAAAGLSYSLAVRKIILIRKRREIGDGPI
jgi:hypothetical protein